jgi:hypothetical protein
VKPGEDLNHCAHIPLKKISSLAGYVVISKVVMVFFIHMKLKFKKKIHKRIEILKLKKSEKENEMNCGIFNFKKES